jgi:hypothetical protein
LAEGGLAPTRVFTRAFDDVHRGDKAVVAVINGNSHRGRRL